MTNPYVFIVGCPRSGTTLLQRIVNAHSQIAITPESHWIPTLFDKHKGLTPEGLVTPAIIPYLLAHPKFSDLGIERNEIEALLERVQSTPYSNFITQLFDLYGKTKGKALVGNKTPGFVRRLATFHTLWPEARFVHLIRDGRDVHLSTLHRGLKNPKPGIFDTWKDDPATTSALWWELNVRSGRQFGNLLGPKLYYEMRYESLVTHPQQECSALCHFLSLPFDELMLRFHERETRPRAARPITSGLRDWISQMPGEEIERFEAAAGDLLSELGYPRRIPQPLPDRVAAASRIRDTWARDPRMHYGVDREQLRGR